MAVWAVCSIRLIMRGVLGTGGRLSPPEERAVSLSCTTISYSPTNPGSSGMNFLLG
jgi:hypothetical protein